MIDHAVVALEHGLDLPLELAVRVQARDLVLVLVGEELGVVARHRFREFCRACLRLSNSFHQAAIAFGVGGVLVFGQELYPPLDELVEVAREVLLDRDHGRRGRDALHPLRVERRMPAPQEALLVELHRHAVQLDGALEGGSRDREPALLVGVAEHEHVGRDGVAHQAARQLGGGNECGVAAAAGLDDVALQIASRQLPVRVLHELGGGRNARVHHRASTGGRHLRDRLGAGGHDEVAADDQVRAAGVEPRRVQVLGPRRDAHVGGHGAVLLREARHVQYRDSLRLEVRRHADDLADGDDASAADPGDENASRVLQIGNFRLRERRQFIPGGGSGFALPEPAALDGDEARAEALQAGVVLVA